MHIKDLKFRRNFKHKMIHPYDVSDRLPEMEFNLKMCTLYKGKPVGPAII